MMKLSKSALTTMILILLQGVTAFAAPASLKVEEFPLPLNNPMYSEVACRTTWLQNGASDVMFGLGSAPVVGTLKDGTKIRLMGNPIAASWGNALPGARNTVQIIASNSKGEDMYFDEAKGDSKIIGGFPITSLNRIKVTVNYQGQEFYLFCQPVAL